MAADLTNSQLLEESSIPALEQHLDKQVRRIKGSLTGDGVSHVINLHSQVKDGSVDVRCNRALVRLYSIYPGRASANYIALALTKALTVHPEPEFLQLLYSTPEKYHAAGNIKQLIELDQLLHAAEWQKCWSRVAAVQVAGFADAIREYVFGAITRTYARIERSTLASSLNLSQADADAFATKRGATVDGEAIVLPTTAENSEKKQTKAPVDPSVLRPNEVASMLNLLTR